MKARRRTETSEAPRGQGATAGPLSLAASSSRGWLVSRLPVHRIGVICLVSGATFGVCVPWKRVISGHAVEDVPAGALGKPGGRRSIHGRGAHTGRPSPGRKVPLTSRPYVVHIGMTPHTIPPTTCQRTPADPSWGLAIRHLPSVCVLLARTTHRNDARCPLRCLPDSVYRLSTTSGTLTSVILCHSSALTVGPLEYRIEFALKERFEECEKTDGIAAVEQEVVSVSVRLDPVSNT